MTWEEFKQKCEDKGVLDTDKIDWIDVAMFGVEEVEILEEGDGRHVRIN